MGGVSSTAERPDPDELAVTRRRTGACVRRRSGAPAAYDPAGRNPASTVNVAADVDADVAVRAELAITARQWCRVVVEERRSVERRHTGTPSRTRHRSSTAVTFTATASADRYATRPAMRRESVDPLVAARSPRTAVAVDAPPVSPAGAAGVNAA